MLVVLLFLNFQIYLFEELQKWRCPDYYENNVHKMQLPFSSKLLGSTLTAEEKQERRQQQLRRLQELNARRREEKLQLDQERLDRLQYVQVTEDPRWAPGLTQQMFLLYILPYPQNASTELPLGSRRSLGSSV